MQKYCHGYEGRCREVQIYFILVTEHISFLPNNILDHCSILRVKRPSVDDVCSCCVVNKQKGGAIKIVRELGEQSMQHLMNLKEIYSFSLLDSADDIPKDHFNMVCDALIQEMTKIMNGTEGAPLTQFRDLLYDILIYNLDGMECIWYIYCHFVKEGFLVLDSPENRNAMYKLMTIFKQFGNNYRSIFHLENAVFTILDAMCPVVLDDLPHHTP